MGNKFKKTNAMRILDRGKVDYKIHEYSGEAAISGVEVAAVLNQPIEKVFKTLVTIGKSREHYVFMIPVAEELDLKKAAKAVGEKKIEMIKSRELQELTGYIHGGCSPLGMKKQFQTTIDISAETVDNIFFSGGKIGKQIEMPFSELKKVLKYRLFDLCEIV